ncbi:MAG TPA: cytochrome c-type biogenesis CcmF C-terminal domain-containing protein, partial [Burkholderiaceae bacterium]|nr:cytochrome c-type biogenesis CcmF C-terminal domain-containing protein [Burkholderiaceae bacterium]
AVFAPLMAPLVLLMGVGPLARWKSADAHEVARLLRWPALASVATALAVPVAAGRFSFGAAFGLLLAAWVATSTALLLWRQRRHGQAALWRAGASFWGMVVAHLGVAVFIVGVTMVRSYEAQADVKMSIGDHVDLAGWRFTLDGLNEAPGPNYVALRAQITVTRDGAAPFTMQPEKRLYKVQSMPMTEAAIDTRIARDLYVALGEAIDEKTWTVRVHHKPFVTWIWGGAFIMALGAALAIGDRRYRLAAARTNPAPTVVVAP